MAGLVPAIHVLLSAQETRMPGTGPGMTVGRLLQAKWKMLSRRAALTVADFGVRQCLHPEWAASVSWHAQPGLGPKSSSTMQTVSAWDGTI